MRAQQAAGWTRRAFLGGVTLAGTAELLRLHARRVTTEPPPETVCLSSQIDRHRRTALHFERDDGGAGPPRRPFETRPTPVGAGEAAAAV